MVQEVFGWSQNKCFEIFFVTLCFQECYRTHSLDALYKWEPKLTGCCPHFQCSEVLWNSELSLFNQEVIRYFQIAFGNSAVQVSVVWANFPLADSVSGFNSYETRCSWSLDRASAWNTWLQPLCVQSSTRGLPDNEAGLALAAFMLKSILHIVWQLLCFGGAKPQCSSAIATQGGGAT